MVSAIPAPASVPLRSATITAVSAPTMPAHRLNAFRESVAARLRAGTPISTVLREQQALAVALADPNFENQMAALFVVEMRAQEPNPAYFISPLAAKRQVHGILQNRIRDCHGFIAALGDPAFIESAGLLAAQPAPPPKEYDLPPEKKQEVADRLGQPNHPAGAEPEVHIAASALGQRMVHMALARIFRPLPSRPGEQTLYEQLEAALVKAWPEATGAQLQEVTKRWLKARHDPAHSIADGLKETGEIYRLAVQLAEASRTPARQIGVPAQAPGKIRTADEMAVGAIQ
jgi:hypothetical protein